MKSCDLAWAAGLFEGEGSFNISKNKNRKDSYAAQVNLSSTDEDVIRTFHKILNIGNCGGPYYKISKYSKKPRWTWYVCNYQDCKEVCEKLLPYLHFRRIEKAKEMISFCEQRMLKYPNRIILRENIN